MTTSGVLDFALGPDLTAEEARAIYARGKEAVIFALLELAAQLRRLQGQCASVSSPATPSGMKPIHQKPNTPRRRKKPGREAGQKAGQKAGHEGHRRPRPEVVHERKTHRAAGCPHCQGPLKRCANARTRYTDDIPESLALVVTEHAIHRDWCPRCRKAAEPRVSDALPRSPPASTRPSCAVFSTSCLMRWASIWILPRSNGRPAPIFRDQQRQHRPPRRRVLPLSVFRAGSPPFAGGCFWLQ